MCIKGGKMSKRKVILYLAASLDGFIATKEHKLDWLFEVEGDGDNGYSKFAETVDTVLIGRTTYDWVMEQENGKFPYPDKESYVFSRTEHAPTEYVQFVDGDLTGFIQKLKAREGKDIWLVGGGELIHSFLAEDLIDELMITVAPIILGSGIPLFAELG
jgi:dihydrofolate reductase